MLELALFIVWSIMLDTLTLLDIKTLAEKLEQAGGRDAQFYVIADEAKDNFFGVKNSVRRSKFSKICMKWRGKDPAKYADTIRKQGVTPCKATLDEELAWLESQAEEANEAEANEAEEKKAEAKEPATKKVRVVEESKPPATPPKQPSPLPKQQSPPPKQPSPPPKQPATPPKTISETMADDLSHSFGKLSLSPPRPNSSRKESLPPFLLDPVDNNNVVKEIGTIDCPHVIHMNADRPELHGNRFYYKVMPGFETHASIYHTVHSFEMTVDPPDSTKVIAYIPHEPAKEYRDRCVCVRTMSFGWFQRQRALILEASGKSEDANRKADDMSFDPIFAPQSGREFYYYILVFPKGTKLDNNILSGSINGNRIMREIIPVSSDDSSLTGCRHKQTGCILRWEIAEHDTKDGLSGNLGEDAVKASEYF